MLHREAAISFISQNYETQFYQPVLFSPGVLEIRGKWHDSTKQLANQLLFDIRGQSVLDLGCCTGFFLQEAKRYGASKCVGIDHDIVALGKARQINDIMGLDIEYICHEIETFNYVNSFDVCLILNVLHMVKSPELLLPKLKNISKKIIIECDEVLTPLFLNDAKSLYPSARSRDRNIAVLF